MTDNVSCAAFDEKAIDALFATLDQDRLPGAGVGIASGGRPVYAKGFGLANMELPVRLASTTRLRIYSITKQFTCLALLLLCEQGRASVDDPIGKFLPELHPANRAVTLGQLMGHVSGLRDAKDIVLQFSGTGRAVSSTELLSTYERIDDLNFPTGSGWCYNNGGYLMLTTAIERLAQKSFEEVLSELIFQPLGMCDTLVRRYDTDFVPNSATLHTLGVNGAYERSYLGIASAGEGGIVSTVDDMLRWLAHMDAPIIGDEATWQRIVTPQRLLNGTSTGYGAGLMQQTYRGITTLQHSGGGLGGNSQLLKVPAARLDVVIMVNRSDVSAGALADRILEVCLGLPAVQPHPVIPPLQGTFCSAKTGRVLDLFTKDGQQLASLDALDIPVTAEGAGVLRPVDLFAYLQTSFRVVGDLGRPRAIEVTEFGNVDAFEPVPKPGRADTVAGRYLSQATDTEAVFLETANEPILVTTGRFGSARFNLQHLGTGLWRSVAVTGLPLGGILSFERDGSQFRFFSSRTRDLVFRRVP